MKMESPPRAHPGRSLICSILLDRLNLASFVTTWMEPECDDVINEARNVNYIDEVQCPGTMTPPHVAGGCVHAGRAGAREGVGRRERKYQSLL